MPQRAIDTETQRKTEKFSEEKSENDRSKSERRRRRRVYVTDGVATRNTEGETLNSRLQLFLFSLFPSLEGIFGSKEELMAARAVAPQQPLRIRGVEINLHLSLHLDFSCETLTILVFDGCLLE